MLSTHAFNILKLKSCRTIMQITMACCMHHSLLPTFVVTCNWNGWETEIYDNFKVKLLRMELKTGNWNQLKRTILQLIEMN